MNKEVKVNKDRQYISVAVPYKDVNQLSSGFNGGNERKWTSITNKFGCILDAVPHSAMDGEKNSSNALASAPNMDLCQEQPIGERSSPLGHGRGRGTAPNKRSGRGDSRNRGGRGGRGGRGENSGGHRNREIGRSEWRCVRHHRSSSLFELISEAKFKLTSGREIMRGKNSLRNES